MQEAFLINASIFHPPPLPKCRAHVYYAIRPLMLMTKSVTNFSHYPEYLEYVAIAGNTILD